MQIKVQAKKIQLIRTHYKAEKKRTEGKVFKTFDICSCYAGVPADVIAMLDETEVSQLKDWFENREKDRADNSATFDIEYAPMRINSIVKSISNEKAAALLNQKKATEIYEAMDALKKALKKAGFEKPAKAPKAPTSDPRQTDIIDSVAANKINLNKD